MNLASHILPYKHQIVRDLAWVISSPPIIKGSKFFAKDIFDEEYNSLKNKLALLDNDPIDLQKFISKSNVQLLGKYFEELIKYWFKISERFKLIESNIQVVNVGRTVGEIDFIIYDTLSKKYYNVEAAGKFYISSVNSNQHKTFIGPNANDDLNKKISKALNTQLILTKYDLVKSKLEENRIEQIEPRMILKGYLFYHLNYFINGEFTLPDNAEDEHQKGWWIYNDQVNLLHKLKSNYWIILNRSLWISRVYLIEPERVRNLEELKLILMNYFQENNYPLILVTLEQDNQKNYFELSRGFIVNNEWPSKKPNR